MDPMIEGQVILEKGLSGLSTRMFRMETAHLYTKEELDEYRQVFVLFDTDNSGAIGTDELRDAMRSFGMAPTEKELDALILEVDADGNGEIDFDEFCACLKKMTTKKETDEDVIRECFSVFDADNNGIISESEFKKVLKDLGNFSDQLNDVVFKEVDVAGNGHIDYDEFAQMVRNYLLDDDRTSIAQSSNTR